MELLELFKLYLSSNAIKASSNTIKNYQADIRHFILWFENLTKSEFDPRKVSADIIRLYEKSKGGLLQSGEIDSKTQFSHASVKRHLSSLRKFFTFLENSGSNISNPFSKIAPEIDTTPTDYWHLKSFKDFLLSSKASKLTVKNYVSDIQTFAKWYEEAIVPTLSNPLVARGGFYLITQEIIEDYKNRLLTIQNAAPRTINRKLSSLRKYLDFAYSQGFIEKRDLYVEAVETSQSVDNLTDEKFKLKDIIEEKSEYTLSRIPPIRLLQRTIIFPYLLTEEKIVNIIYSIIAGKPANGYFRLPKKIANQIEKKNSLRQNEQNISSILGVKNLQKDFYQPKSISLNGEPIYKRILHHLKYSRPNWYQKYHSYTFVHYIHFAMLIIFASAVGIGLYTNLISPQKKYASIAPTGPPSTLYFKGKLTDSQNNPITTLSHVKFAIYSDPVASGSSLLWHEDDNLVSPNNDGVFTIVLGKKNGIPKQIYSMFDNLYLGVTIGSSNELSPRQKLAAPFYVRSAQTLQGMLPSTKPGITSLANVVLALDSQGNLILSDLTIKDHAIKVTNGNLELSGDSLRLVTNYGSDGDIVILPEGHGKIDLQKAIYNSTSYGHLGNGSVEIADTLAVLATSSGATAFIVNNDGYADLFAASSSGSPKFVITSDGTVISTNYNGQNGVIYGTQSTGILAQTTTDTKDLCLISGPSSPSWGSCATGTTISPFKEIGDIITTTSQIDNFILGENLNSAKFSITSLSSGTPIASISASNNKSSLSLSADGIITTSNKQTLILGSSYSGDIHLQPQASSSKGSVIIGTIPASGVQSSLLVNGENTGKSLVTFNSTSPTQDIFVASASGNTKFVLNSQGNVGIGTIDAPTGISPTAKLQVYSNIDDQPAASISAKSQKAALTLTQDGNGDILTASVSGATKVRITNDGSIFYSGALVAMGSDLAEYFKKGNPTEDFMPGQLVCLGNSGAEKCSAGNDGILIGVVSDNAFLKGGGDKSNDPSYVLVGLLGQLEIWINGPVKAGDALTFSNIPGVATKAVDEGMIVGYAKDDNNDSLKRVASIVNPTYYNPYLSYHKDAYDNEIKIIKYGEGYVIVDALGNIKKRIDMFSEVFIAKLTAGSIYAKETISDNFKSTTGFIDELGGTTASFINGAFRNLSASFANIGRVTTASLAVVTEDITINGKNIRDYVISIVQEAGITPLPVSPLASSETINTDIITPLTDTSAPRIAFKEKRLNIENNEGNNVAWFDSTGNASISGELTTESISTTNISAANSTINNITSQNLNTENATISGSLYAQNINLSQEAVNQLNSNLSIDQKIATLASNLKNIDTQNRTGLTSTSSAQPSCYISSGKCVITTNLVMADHGIFEQGITAMGPVTAEIISATDQLSIGNSFYISNNAVNTVGADLEIQSFRQGIVAFQGGLIKMDTDGNMEIAGNLNVLGEVDAVYGVFSGSLTTLSLSTSLISPLPGDDLNLKLSENASSQSGRLIVSDGKGKEVLSVNSKGDITSSGSATFGKLNFNIVGQAQATSLSEATATGSAGFATLRAGQPEITIKNPNITSKSLIYITPFGNTNNKVLYLLRQIPQSDEEDGSFTVGVSGTTTQNLQFNWLIVN